ncbi:Histidine kinase (plasmid) [Rhodovastum atsumiense]|nr:CHASE3 domain-containing protein [Rhodovastum atsumiense]CAH2605833.1 Histidine kinase [Rhodovastum atsumiense]
MADSPVHAHDTKSPFFGLRMLREPARKRRGATATLWGALLLLIATASSLVFAVLALRSGLGDLDRLSGLRLDLELLLTDLKDVETGQRGYLITGDPVFLDPYKDAHPRVDMRLDRLLGEAPQDLGSAPLNSLRELADRKLAITDATIAMARAGQLDNARTSVEQGNGKRVMDAIRRAVAQAHEDVEHRRAAVESRVRGRAVLASAVALGSAVLASRLVGATALIIKRHSAGRLRLAEEERTLALDAAGLGTWEWDWRTDGVTACPVTRRLLGLPTDATLSWGDLLDAVCPGDRNGAKAALRGAAGRGGCEWEGRVGREDGKPRWARLTGGLYSDHGRPTVLRGVAQDVTARREAEARMQSLQAELWHALRVSTVGEAASAMAHELAQPLSAASTFIQGCEALLRSDQPDDREEALSGLGRGLDALGRASGVVHNLRRFLRKEALRRESVDLNAAVREAVRLGAMGFESTGGGHIAYDLADGLPPILADRTQVQQVVVNLVRNAVEAMPSGGLWELRVTTAPHEDGVRLSVADTGPGLPPEIARTPFRAFATTKSGGLGLGLSICRSIVRAHGGAIDVSTGPDGTTFTIDLPAAPEEHDAKAA